MNQRADFLLHEAINCATPSQPAYDRILSRYFPIAAKVRTKDAAQEPFGNSVRRLERHTHRGFPR